MTSIYDKENDLQRQRKKRLKNALDEDIKYYDDLILFCRENGIAREEHKFKRFFLSKNNFKFYAVFKDSGLNRIQKVLKILFAIDVTRMAPVLSQSHGGMIQQSLIIEYC